jgi:hypothetical protein
MQPKFYTEIPERERSNGRPVSRWKGNFKIGKKGKFDPVL